MCKHFPRAFNNNFQELLGICDTCRLDTQWKLNFYFRVNVLCTIIIMTDYLHQYIEWESLGNSGTYLTNLFTTSLGLATAQTVSRRLPTATAMVRAQVMSCGICGGQNGTGAGFLRVFRFPLPIIIPPTVPRSSSITQGFYSYNRPVGGRRTKWTQSHPTPRNYRNY
jgi:hypothetical protein